MGMRKYYRGIAKERLKALGAGKVNTKMNGKFHLSKGQIRKMAGTTIGRRKLNMLAKSGIANWRRVLWGDLAKDGLAAQMKQGQIKKVRQLRLKAARKLAMERKHRKLTKVVAKA